MRAVVRRLLPLMIVVLAVAPAWPILAAHPRADSLELRPADAALLGTWTGTVLLEGTPEPLDGGLITIAGNADRLSISIGPNPRVRYSCVRLSRTEHGLKFEAELPGDMTRLLAYDVVVDDGVMTGTVTFVRYGLTKPGRILFVRR